MERGFSASLDLLRFTAALTVFYEHLTNIWLGGWQEGRLAVAHSAVVVFFVLSGCVISWSAKREPDGAHFLISRATRIYSVAVPALVLTYLLDVSTGHITYQHLQPWKYVPFFLSFTTDFWFLGENAFSNIPWWSLCYEVWYYIVFGLAFFGRGRWRWFAIAAALALMGPRLWLLFPIWLMGAAIHKAPPMRHARPVLLACLAAVVAIKATGLEGTLNDAMNAALGGFAQAHLRFSKYFAGDYVFATVTTLAIWALRDAHFTFSARSQRFAAAIASVTFSLYLVHYPLLLAAAHVFRGNIVVFGSIAFVGAVLFGLVFERNKHVTRVLLLKILGPLLFAPVPASAALPGQANAIPIRRHRP